MNKVELQQGLVGRAGLFVPSSDPSDTQYDADEYTIRWDNAVLQRDLTKIHPVLHRNIPLQSVEFDMESGYIIMTTFPSDTWPNEQVQIEFPIHMSIDVADTKNVIQRQIVVSK